MLKLKNRFMVALITGGLVESIAKQTDNTEKYISESDLEYINRQLKGYMFEMSPKQMNEDIVGSLNEMIKFLKETDQ